MTKRETVRISKASLLKFIREHAQKQGINVNGRLSADLYVMASPAAAGFDIELVDGLQVIVRHSAGAHFVEPTLEQRVEGVERSLAEHGSRSSARLDEVEKNVNDILVTLAKKLGVL